MPSNITFYGTERESLELAHVAARTNTRDSTNYSGERGPHALSGQTDSPRLGLNPNHGRNDGSESTQWQLGVISDRGGHVHVGAVLAGAHLPVYIDLLSAVGAASAAELDLDQLVVLVTGTDVADLRRVAEEFIEDPRLRNRLVELTDLSASAMARAAWTG